VTWKKFGDDVRYATYRGKGKPIEHHAPNAERRRAGHHLSPSFDGECITVIGIAGRMCF
jgi:hypothetical protein